MTTIVELSGDEAGLLRSLQKVIEKEREHERQLASLGNAGDNAGQTLEAALDRVRKAEDQTLKSLMGDLRKLGPEGQAAAQALTGHFSETGRAGLKNFESVIAQIQKIDPAAAEVLAGVQAQFAAAGEAAKFDRAIDSLKALGPEGAAIAKGIAEDLAKASASSAASLDSVVAEIISMRPEVAASADRIKKELTEAARVSEFNSTLDSLKALGPEGSAIAKGIQEDMQKASAASAAGLDDVLAKLKEMDPAAAASAERVRMELAEAARFTEGRFASTLDELRKIGPVGKQVADQMRKHLVEAGEISEKSVEDVIAKIRQIDPAAAEAAEKMHKEIESANQKGGNSFAKFAKSSIAKIGAMAGAYFSVQEAVNVVNKSLEVQEGLIKSAYDRQMELAKAQQESAKNFAGMTAFEQSGMLKDVPFRIARQAGFSDVPAIQSALGNSVSAGASFEDAEAAVLAAAKSNRLTPEKLSAAASASIDLGKSTGSKDVISNLALLTTTGAQARIEDPLALAKTLAPVLNNVANSVPSEGKESAPIQGASLFSALTQYATDGDGKRSETATTQFTGELGKFFGDLEMQQRNARSKAELIDRKIDKGKDTEKDRFEREQIKQFLKESEGLKDPGTLRGRIQTLQNNEGIRDQFYSRDFGEQAFKGAFKSISDSSSDVAKAFEKNLGIITNDPEAFNRLQGTIDNGTPELILANMAARLEATRNLGQLQNREGSALNSVRETTSKTLEETRSPGIFAGTVQSLSEGFTIPGLGIPVGDVSRGGLPGGTAAEEATIAISRLMSRRTELLDDGVDSNDVEKVAAIDKAIEELRGLLVNQAYPLSSESRLAAAERSEAAAGNLKKRLTLDDEGNITRFNTADFFKQLADDLRAAATSSQRPDPVSNLISPGTIADANPVEPGPIDASGKPATRDADPVKESVDRLSEKIDAQNELVAKQNELLEKQAAAAERTADATTTTAASTTQPRPNYASAQQAAAAAGSAP